MAAGRNDPCPCGSGRRYKHCCGALAGTAGAVPGGASAHGDGNALLDAADALRMSGRARESLPLYQRALEKEPRDPVAQNNLGNAFLVLGQCADAAAAYRRALALSPLNADVQCNLANALRQLGQLAEARVASERAIALNPKLSMAHNNLGLVLTGIGQRREAVASYRQALQLNPDYVEALNNLGNALRDLGERREALAVHAKAVQFDAQRAESHCYLGNVLFDLRRLDEAAASFRRALELQPQYPQALLGLASVRRSLGHDAEAETLCNRALALDPKCVDALTFLGELRADRGRFAEAQDLFEQARLIDPQLPSVYCSLVANRKVISADAEWLQGVRALLAKPLPLGHEINLNYALGKYFDDLGQYDEAFGSYRQANELSKRYGASYNRTKLIRRIEQMLSYCDAAFLRQCQTAASASELPVFIVGMPRSGTSLTEQILASHPAIFGAGEVSFWDGAFRAFEAARAKGERGVSLVSGMAGDYLARQTGLSPGALRVVDKMPANFLYTGLIHAAFPRARIIHMQRHPLDTCLSIYSQNFFNIGPYAHDFEDLAHYYSEYVRISDYWRTLLPATALLEVPYEALVADPEGWTRRLIDFVGLPWDAKCLDFHQTERVVMTASRWQVRQKISAASVGRWRNYEKHLAPLRHLTELSAQPMRVASSRPSSGA